MLCIRGLVLPNCHLVFSIRRSCQTGLCHINSTLKRLERLPMRLLSRHLVLGLGAWGYLYLTYIRNCEIPNMGLGLHIGFYQYGYVSGAVGCPTGGWGCLLGD